MVSCRTKDFLPPSRRTFIVSSLVALSFPQSSQASGRATLEYAQERYIPRIKAGKSAYKKDVFKAVKADDMAGLASAIAEPRGKTNDDKTKADGGFADRAASAGPFSDARVLTAMDLYAAAFSDHAESEKTRNMKREVSKLRSIVAEWRDISSKGKKGAGSRVKELYKEGGDAFNRYVYEANLGLNIKFEKLEYL